MSNFANFKRQFVAWVHYHGFEFITAEFVNIGGITRGTRDEFEGGIFITDPTTGTFYANYDEDELIRLAARHGMQATIMNDHHDCDVFILLQQQCVGV